MLLSFFLHSSFCVLSWYFHTCVTIIEQHYLCVLVYFKQISFDFYFLPRNLIYVNDFYNIIKVYTRMSRIGIISSEGVFVFTWIAFTRVMASCWQWCPWCFAFEAVWARYFISMQRESSISVCYADLYVNFYDNLCLNVVLSFFSCGFCYWKQVKMLDFYVNCQQILMADFFIFFFVLILCFMTWEFNLIITRTPIIRKEIKICSKKKNKSLKRFKQKFEKIFYKSI